MTRDSTVGPAMAAVRASPHALKLHHTRDGDVSATVEDQAGAVLAIITMTRVGADLRLGVGSSSVMLDAAHVRALGQELNAQAHRLFLRRSP